MAMIKFFSLPAFIKACSFDRPLCFPDGPMTSDPNHKAERSVFVFLGICPADMNPADFLIDAITQKVSN